MQQGACLADVNHIVQLGLKVAGSRCGDDLMWPVEMQPYFHEVILLRVVQLPHVVSGVGPKVKFWNALKCESATCREAVIRLDGDVVENLGAAFTELGSGVWGVAGALAGVVRLVGWTPVCMFLSAAVLAEI